MTTFTSEETNEVIEEGLQFLTRIVHEARASDNDDWSDKMREEMEGMSRDQLHRLWWFMSYITTTSRVMCVAFQLMMRERDRRAQENN